VGRGGARAPLFLFEARGLFAKISLAKLFAQNFSGKLRLVFRKVELFAGRSWARIAIRAANFAARSCASAKLAGRVFPPARKIDV